MPVRYDGTNAADFDGVARLMSDLGVAVDMQYTEDGSGSYISDLVAAMQKYFGYSKISHQMSIEAGSAEEWNEKLRGEIDANRPVLYAAFDSIGGGHAFVIDGYKDDSFSVNWGWGGLCNGFYHIGALNPQNEEGKPVASRYNVGQMAVFGMEPSDGKEKISDMRFTKMTDYLQEMNMNVTDVKKGQKCIVFSVPIKNEGKQNFDGVLAMALMNAKGEIREIISSSTKTVKDFGRGYIYPKLVFTVLSTVDAEPGDYLAVVAKRNGSEEYMELYGQDFERLRLPATGYEPRTFEVRTKIGEGVTFEEAGSQYNPSRNFYNGKPVIGSTYYYYLTVDEGVSKYYALVDGKLAENIVFGAGSVNSVRGLEPVYELEVRTYRNLESTGIHSVTSDQETGNDAIYDLSGRRITGAMKKGIYIKNGKKFCVR